jgi:hypothetical protein
VIVAVLLPVVLPACPTLSTSSKQELIGEQDAAKDPDAHSLMFIIIGTRMREGSPIGVTVKDVTPAGMLGQYQT